MIPFKINDRARVDVRLGDKATLATDGKGSLSDPKFVDAVYFGSTLETRKLHGEGHLFAALNRRDEPLFYLASSLEMQYCKNGDNDPGYALCISARRADEINLNSSEKKYVQWVLDKRRK